MNITKKLFTVIILSAISFSSVAGSEYTYLNGMKIKINNNSNELSTENKVPVINVNEKDNSGSAHIKYNEFNVGKRGLLFNNNINANIIINEVVSDSPTRLSGNMTVRGQQAELLIVNPNGITCSSCSFTNTSHAYLIAGKAGEHDDITDPEISEYESKGKKISIRNMKQNAAGELSLIARNIEVKNSNIKVKNINLKTILSSYGDGRNHANSINIDKKSIVSADNIRVNASNGTIINNGYLTGNIYSNLKNISLKNNGRITGESAHTYLSGNIYINGSKSINFKEHNVTDDNKDSIFWNSGETIIN